MDMIERRGPRQWACHIYAVRLDLVERAHVALHVRTEVAPARLFLPVHVATAGEFAQLGDVDHTCWRLMTPTHFSLSVATSSSLRRSPCSVQNSGLSSVRKVTGGKTASRSNNICIGMTVDARCGAEL